MNLNVNDTRRNKTDIEDMSNSDYLEILNIIGEISKKLEAQIDSNITNTENISKTGKLILMSLFKKEGQTQLELAKSIYLKAPTVSLTAQKLESAGYIDRKIDQYDLRAVRVYLTEKGKNFCAEVNRIFATHNRYMTEIVSELEKKQLLRTLNLIKKSIVF